MYRDLIIAILGVLLIFNFIMDFSALFAQTNMNDTFIKIIENQHEINVNNQKIHEVFQQLMEIYHP